MIFPEALKGKTGGWDPDDQESRYKTSIESNFNLWPELSKKLKCSEDEHLENQSRRTIDTLRILMEDVSAHEREVTKDEQQPTTNQVAAVIAQDCDTQELESLKANPGAMENVTLRQLCSIFDYGPNSQTGVIKKVDEYNSRFPETPINFHIGKGGSKCLYFYEAMFIRSKIGGASGRRKSRQSPQKKT